MAKKRTKRAYGKASWQMREAAREAAAANPELGAAARLLEDLKDRGLGAVQDGDLSFEAVTAAVQTAVTGPTEDADLDGLDDDALEALAADDATLAEYGTSDGARRGWDTRGRGRRIQAMQQQFGTRFDPSNAPPRPGPRRLSVSQRLHLRDKAKANARRRMRESAIVATHLDSVIFSEDGTFFEVPYRLIPTAQGIRAEIIGEPKEVEFTPTPMLAEALAESRDTALIEARPAGRLNPGALKRDLNIIEGTVLITSLSQNGAGKGGRRYSDGALKQIASMAEGLPAYLNHVAPEQAFRPRDVKDLIGVHRNVRYHPHEGKITSDLHVMEHQAPLVFGIAEKLGDHIGNSLVSRGLVQMEGETEVVKEVLAVRSADLVSDPATTRGLFESRQDFADPFGALIAEIRESLIPHTEDTRMDLAAILAHLKATPSDQKALAEHFGLVLKTDVEAEIKPLKEEQAALQARTEKAEADLKEAQVKLDGFEAQAALSAKRAKIETVIAEHDLGKKFGKNQDAVSAKFKTLLEGFGEDQWKDLLDDRLKSLQGAAPAPRLPQSGLKSANLTEANGTAAITEGAHARLAEAITIR